MIIRAQILTGVTGGYRHLIEQVARHQYRNGHATAKPWLTPIGMFGRVSSPHNTGMSSPAPRHPTTLLVMLLILAACTGGATGTTPTTTTPTTRTSTVTTSTSEVATTIKETLSDALMETTCPDDFQASPGGAVICAYLTVPEDRSEADGRQIRLFVARWRPAGDLTPDPLLGFDELGWALHTPEPGGGPTAPVGYGGEVIQLNVRGTGRSEPSLACPEVEDEIASSLSAASDDPEAWDGFLKAVGSCHDRLVGEGIDLADYNMAEAAADAEDLRIALGVDQWNLRGFGTGARYAFEIIRRYPESVRAAYLDTPEAPQRDLLSTAIVGTRLALRELTEACASDPVCDQAFPDLGGVIEASMLENAENPDQDLQTHEGIDVPLVWDDALQLRAIREALTWTPELIPSAFFTTTVGNDYWIANGPAFLFGYIPDEDSPVFDFSHGAFFSTLCRDQLAFVDQTDLTTLAEGHPSYIKAFANAPFFEMCRVWDVGTAPSEVHQPVTSDVPVLLLVGRFGPYAPRPLVDEIAETLSSSFIVELPNEGHNTLSTLCVRDIRNAWLDNPTSPPDASSCLADHPAIEFAGT